MSGSPKVDSSSYVAEKLFAQRPEPPRCRGIHSIGEHAAAHTRLAGARLPTVASITGATSTFSQDTPPRLSN